MGGKLEILGRLKKKPGILGTSARATRMPEIIVVWLTKIMNFSLRQMALIQGVPSATMFDTKPY